MFFPFFFPNILQTYRTRISLPFRLWLKSWPDSAKRRERTWLWALEWVSTRCGPPSTSAGATPVPLSPPVACFSHFLSFFLFFHFFGSFLFPPSERHPRSLIISGILYFAFSRFLIFHFPPKRSPFSFFQIPVFFLYFLTFDMYFDVEQFVHTCFVGYFLVFSYFFVFLLPLFLISFLIFFFRFAYSSFSGDRVLLSTFMTKHPSCLDPSIVVASTHLASISTSPVTCAFALLERYEKPTLQLGIYKYGSLN